MKITTGTIKLGLLAMGIVLAVSPLGVQAKERGRESGPRINFELLDANSDGQVTQDEMMTHAQARFAEADSNGDGYLTQGEMTSQMQAQAGRRMAQMFERRDTDGDGRLSQEEISPSADRISQRFERLDTDGSGGISKEEFAAMKRGGRPGKRGE